MTDLMCGTLSKAFAKSIMIIFVCICLFVSTIHSPIKVVNDVMHTLGQPGFAKPLTVETMLTFSKYAI